MSTTLPNSVGRVRTLLGAVATLLVAILARDLPAQPVPLDAAALASIHVVTRPRATLDGAALDSALVHLEFAKWALGNVGRIVETEPLFAERFLNVGLEPTGVRRIGKADLFAMMRAIRMPPMPMELGDWKIVRAGADARLVSFALRAMGGRMWVASLWARQPDGWATVFYQITPDAPMSPIPAAQGKSGW